MRKTNHFKCVPAVLSALSVLLIPFSLQAQESSKKFAHVRLPAEISHVTQNAHEAFAGNSKNIWRIDTKTWKAESAFSISSDKWSADIQGMAGHGEGLWFYVSGEGIHRLGSKGTKPQLVRPRNDDFIRNIEEAYSGMNIDPTGRCLLLYGKNENAAVFDIANGMKPVVVFNDFVRDAYWLGNMLWAGCPDKLVLNKRTGRSMENNDFIEYGDNDQHGMVKFYVSKEPVVPKMGEQRVNINASGEMQRLIYNKANGDLLLCVSSIESGSKTQIYKMAESGGALIAEFNGYYGDFAAYGQKIIAMSGGGFVEVNYGSNSADLKPKPMTTDILKPKAWSGQKPQPYEIGGSDVVDFDNNGNLWIAYGRDLFVRFRQ